MNKENSKINVLIADDHAIVREGLKNIIAETSDIVVKDEASNGAEVIKKILKNDYDMIVLDITMPGRDGIDVLKQIKSFKPDLGILIMSMHPEDQFAYRALELGASGYINKEKAPKEMIEAIRKVASGRKYISASLAEKLAVSLQIDSKVPLHKKLSDRENQVLRMITSGKTAKEISVELSLSSKTISTYRTRMLEKMDMRTDAQLTYYSILNGLLD